MRFYGSDVIMVMVYYKIRKEVEPIMDESRSVIFHVDKDVLPADELKSCIVDFYDLPPKRGCL